MQSTIGDTHQVLDHIQSPSNVKLGTSMKKLGGQRQKSRHRSVNLLVGRRTQHVKEAYSLKDRVSDLTAGYQSLRVDHEFAF